MVNNYWDRINKLDRQINDLTEKARTTNSNKENAALIDQIYNLRQEKKSLQRNQAKLVRSTRG